MKPVCVKCQRFFRPTKTGIKFIEGMPENGARPGLVDAAKWSPYKLWTGDQWSCPDCGAVIIVGVPLEAIAEHYQPDFSRLVEAYQPELQVNDC